MVPAQHRGTWQWRQFVPFVTIRDGGSCCPARAPSSQQPWLCHYPLNCVQGAEQSHIAEVPPREGEYIKSSLPDFRFIADFEIYRLISRWYVTPGQNLLDHMLPIICCQSLPCKVQETGEQSTVIKAPWCLVARICRRRSSHKYCVLHQPLTW